MTIVLISLLNISLAAWIQLFSGLAAVVVACLAIIHGNKNSKDALVQQNMTLIHQYNEKKLDEYNRCLRENIELLNVADVLGPMVSISHTDYSLTKHEICLLKSKIYSYDLRYKYLFSNQEVNIKNLMTEYDNKWEQAITTLSALLDKMLEYVDYLSQFAAENEIIKNVVQQIEIYSRMAEIDKMKQSQYSSEINRLRVEQFELSSHHSNFKEEIDKYTGDIQKAVNLLRDQSAVLLYLSQNVIAELKGRLLDARSVYRQQNQS